jgi:hypothetical protein
MSPTSHIRSAALQILAAATLTEKESILPENTMAISWTVGHLPSASCAHYCPTVPGVRSSVPQEHACMTTVFEHLKPHSVPTNSHMPGSFPIAPTMQTIVVDRESVVDPQLAAII